MPIIMITVIITIILILHQTNLTGAIQNLKIDYKVS